MAQPDLCVIFNPAAGKNRGRRRLEQIQKSWGTHVDQVWSSDITYIRLAQGWLYLVAVLDVETLERRDRHDLHHEGETCEPAVP